MIRYKRRLFGCHGYLRDKEPNDGRVAVHTVRGHDMNYRESYVLVLMSGVTRQSRCFICDVASENILYITDCGSTTSRYLIITVAHD